MTLELINFILWGALGLFAGLTLYYIGESKQNLFPYIIWGIVGAVLGGLITQFVQGSTQIGLSIPSLLFSLIGSLVVLIIIKSTDGGNGDIFEN